MSLQLIIYFIFSTSRKFPFQDRQLQCLDTDFCVEKNLLYFISCRCTEEAHKFLIANRKMSFEKSIIFICKVVGDMPFQPCHLPGLNSQFHFIVEDFLIAVTEKWKEKKKKHGQEQNDEECYQVLTDTVFMYFTNCPRLELISS